MCGIVGGICGGDIGALLVKGLMRLEYRGYDSAGIAVAGDSGVAERHVTLARTAALRQTAASLAGGIGIGHTRWATHGAPSDENAHPLRAGRVMLVHNGIIENHADLRRDLIAAGRVFSGETDTEVIAHLLDIALAARGNLLAAWRDVRPKLTGAYAIAAIADGMEQVLGAREGSPLLLGVHGDGSVYLASDATALAGIATRVHYFENGDYALLTRDGARLFNAADEEQTPVLHPFDGHGLDVQLGEYTHFMQKEIFDQPDAVAATMQPFVGGSELPIRRFGTGAARAFRRARQVVIVACGTSYHAGLIASCWLEKIGVPCRVDIASEYRYRPHPNAADTLFIAVSQSGETADTLLAMRAAKDAGATTLAIVNVNESSMLREADFTLRTRAGAEIGVASTKAFTAQLTALLLLTAGIARARSLLPAQEEETLLHQLRQLPHLLRKTLLLEDAVQRWAQPLAAAKSAMYIGRRLYYPLALEGALKLKEISYIHAEGIAAGELKHGSLALVDSDLPVIGIAPDDDLLEKTTANLTEVATRGGQLYVLAGQRFQLDGVDDSRIIRLEGIDEEDGGGEYLSPMVYAVLLQLIAYYTARQKGTDIDKPRNLAKAVTVE